MSQEFTMIEVLKSETTNLHYDATARVFSGRVKFDYRRFGSDKVHSANIVTRVNVRPDAHMGWIEESLLARAIAEVRDGHADADHVNATIFEHLRGRDTARGAVSRKGLFATLRMARGLGIGSASPALA
jgi:hypothetical protein